MTRIFLPLLACLSTAACVGGQGRFISDLPESVTSIAAPGQNLQAVTVLEEDGCYWYQHVGPVETTLLPLRSRKGGHICTSDAAAN